MTTPNQIETLQQDDQSPEAMLGDDRDSTAIALLEPETGDPGEPREQVGPCCEKCESPLASGIVSICRNCGWYASLGMFVEVDPNWEVNENTDNTQVRPEEISHLKVWLELVPWWGWVIIGSVAAVVVESLLVRLLTSAGSSLRTTWSLSQLAIGLLALLLCHTYNFLVQVSDDAEVGLFDVVLKPIKLWLRTFRRLPARLWMVDIAACGLAATILSLVVIGGIPYERLWDWGFTPPAKQELMGAVMDRVKQVESQGADNLEEAVGDFAGKGELDEQPKPTPKPRKSADCVILGYQLDREGRLSTLVLGTAHLGSLVYAGNVTPVFANAAERNQMQTKLAAAKSNRRLIPVEIEATWVKPGITCRVTFGERQANGRLSDVKWDTLLGTIKTQ